MHRRQQPREQFHISDAMDPRNMDCRVMLAQSYEALPPLGSLCSTVMPRPPRPSSSQSMPSSNVIDTGKGHHITSAFQEHVLVLHQMTLTPGTVDPSDPRSLEPLTSPGEMSRTHPSSSSLKDSLRSASVSALTFIENLKNVNAAASQLGEGTKEQP